jgi:hypothetical protein
VDRADSLGELVIEEVVTIAGWRCMVVSRERE